MKYVVLSLTLVLSACTDKSEQKWIDDPIKDRYTLIQLGEYRRDRFMIDKQTGTIWVPTCLVTSKKPGDCEYSAWLKEDVQDITMKDELIYQRASNIEKMASGRK